MSMRKAPPLEDAKISHNPARRVAIVHDWLVTYAGAERVLSALLEIYPQADLFTLVDFLPEAERLRISNKRANTSFVQKLPFARRRYRGYFPFMPLAVEQFDLSEYDLIISSSHAVAKGVIVGPQQRHVCYCHTPVRYAWDLQHKYLNETGLNKGLKSLLARVMLHYVRLWDVRTVHGVDVFVTNSNYVAKRIRRIYGREAAVVYPPVDTEYFVPGPVKENFYLAASRMVPYKRLDLIAAAFRQMPERQLVIIGDGPERAKIERLAGPNVKLLGYQADDVMKDHLQRARAFIFAAEEDFGILPVEAQACGTPVIAFGKGGALETVVDAGDAGNKDATGILFYTQTEAAIVDAVARFERSAIASTACRAWAEGFGPEHFRNAMREVLDDDLAAPQPARLLRPVMR